MKSKDGVKISSKESYKAGYNNRAAKVLNRLEEQLQKGVKPVDGNLVPLEEGY